MPARIRFAWDYFTGKNATAGFAAGEQGRTMENVEIDAKHQSWKGTIDTTAEAGKQGVPTQLLILALVAIFVIPGIAFAGLLLSRYADAERARYQLESVNVARAATAVIDRHLNGLQVVLRTLATSAPLATGDLEGFHDQAARLKILARADIGLRRPDGQQLINTRLPWGTPLPSTSFAIDAEAMATGQPTVSDVFTEDAGHPMVAIVLPVTVGGKPGYLLHVTIETDVLREVIKNLVPPNWLVGVGDRKGVYVTRSRNHAEFSGKPGVPAFLSRAVGNEGTFTGESVFRENVLVGYTRSALSGWLIAASIKQETVESPLWNGLYTLGTFGALALVATSAIGLWLWRFIARPLEALAIASRHVGDARWVVPVRTSLREFVALRDALHEAARQVRSHNDLLETRVAERTLELARANTELTAQMTAREKAENQLRQMQKMEAVGQLTGGIAHDFNNMLSIVIGSLNLIQRRLDRGEADIQRFVNSAMEGANRAATLTSRLLTFSRQQALAPDVVDLSQLITGMSELLHRTIGQTITIRTILVPTLWKTYVDAGQLENALLNLAVNARDAMPEGGSLTIETSNVHLDENHAAIHDEITLGEYVRITVSDTGTGMSDDVLKRAFDPFFTTKKTGTGTGLGLSQVYGFTRQSKGHVTIDSRPGQGTTISLYLPRHQGGEQARTPCREERPLAGGSPREVILVVEDEDRLRHLSVETLGELGYTVLAADGAVNALDLLERHPEINLLLTDIVMPGMNGRQLAEEALRRCPGLRVLYTSGFTREAGLYTGDARTGVSFLPKPFSMQALATRVREVLAVGPAAS